MNKDQLANQMRLVSSIGWLRDGSRILACSREGIRNRWRQWVADAMNGREHTNGVGSLTDASMWVCSSEMGVTPAVSSPHQQRGCGSFAWHKPLALLFPLELSSPKVYLLILE